MTQPPPTNPPQPPTPPDAGADSLPRGGATSPTGLAMRRFMRHRLAMAGAIMVTVMTIACVFGPMLLPNDPTLIRPWLHDLAPGSQAPDALSLNRLATATDSDPILPDTWRPPSGTGETRVTVAYTEEETYRVVLRRGRIHQIGRESDTTYLDSLDLTGDLQTVQSVPDGDAAPRDLPRVKIAKGDRPPPLLFADRERVVIIRAVAAASERHIIIDWQDHRITRIRRVATGDALVDSPDALDIAGSDILAVSRDGAPQLLHFTLGTDALGRDLLTRTLAGGRISLLVGIVATFVSLIIGVIYGALSGYAGGRTDRLMMGAVDVLYAIPFMFVVIILLVMFGRNLIMLFVALGAVQWLTMSRIVRGQVLSLKEQEFVAAARLSGCGPATIIGRHLIPHTIGPVVVYTSLTVPAVILEESFLSFLGLAVQWKGENLASWGLLVNDGIRALGDSGERWWLLIVPALALAITLFGLNAVGDGLRDAFDPKHAKV